MNAIRIIVPLQDGRELVVYFCGSCGNGYGGFGGESGKDIAERCCICSYCGEPLPYIQGEARRSYHDDCQREHRAAREAERLAKAEKLESWEGWVYCEEAGCNEGFFEDIGELIEYFECEEEEGGLAEGRPEFVFICEKRPYGGLDLDNILEQSVEDMHEDAIENLKGVKELQIAIKQFNEANRNLHCYDPDYKRVVRVPR